MAKQDSNQEEQQERQQPSGQPQVVANTFTGGMVKDPIDLYKKSNNYTHARNITPNLTDGEIGGRSAEPSNKHVATVPYTLIGRIYLADDQWCLFSTNNTVSEIGIYNDNTEQYETLLNDIATIGAGLPGLNFNTDNLITGSARRSYDCGFNVYWSDGRRNPDRVLNTAFQDPNPWIQNCVTSAGCTTCTNTTKIDIQQLRLAPLLDVPCLKLSKHQGSGQLINGSYQVCIAYSINETKCTDYIAFSNVYSIFNHIGTGGSINLTISGISNATKIRFTEMEVVVVSMINSQVTAVKLGTYSTNSSVITIDNLALTLITVPIEKIPLANPLTIASDSISNTSDYLVRIGPEERPDFNYQPLANQIVTKFVAVEYPEDYYQKGGDAFGMNVGNLRGEVYGYFIRWVYNTGDKSASYHIPGRTKDKVATLSTGAPTPDDTGVVIATGLMDGWESTEKYPDHTPEVWNSNITGRPDLNLCGQNIRHHKFPDQASFSGTLLSHFNPVKQNTISVMGVYFENIKFPVDNNGVIISDIVGYEILRTVRDGHESIVAKGMVNHMRGYLDGNGNTGLYQNYPYNDLRPDYYLTSNETIGTIGPANPTDWNAEDPLTIVKSDIVSFHSPDTVFNEPFLGKGNLELLQILKGTSSGHFAVPYRHPKFKALTNLSGTILTLLSVIPGIIGAINVASGGVNNLQFAATDKVPMNVPLGVPSVAEGPYGSLSAVTAPIIRALNFTLTLAFLPMQSNIIREHLLTISKSLAPERQFATQYNSHGLYNEPIPFGTTRASFNISDYQYVKGHLQTFDDKIVNNLYRNNYVALKLYDEVRKQPLEIPPFPPYLQDVSRFTITGSPDPSKFGPHKSQIVSYYAAYRVSQLSQYGQIDSTKQVPIHCVQQVKPVAGTYIAQTPIMFGGDTYINRYTEKNSMMFFNDWLVDAPSDFEYDYTNYENVPYPRYWFNNNKTYTALWERVSRSYHLDQYVPASTLFGLDGFYVTNGHFYLFNSGVRDFFVESSVNVGYRDWQDEIAKRFYDPYGFTDVDYMFRSDIIKSDALYRYDYSLSANRFINQYITWGKCLRRDYTPELAYTCFSYFPRKVIYSLPQEEEQTQDNWRIFLPNNYKNFDDKVIAVKDLHKTGAIFLLESNPPMAFAGVETIDTKSTTAYTVGTGQLFDQSLQSISNVDGSYEYASCQSRFSIVNTIHGLYWVSQNTGKIFHYKSGQLTDVGQEAGLKYHLLQYLPCQLIKDVPSYALSDNPVAGVGVQLIFDPLTDLLYICKKDFKVKEGIELNYSNGQWFIGPCPPGSAQVGVDPMTGKPLCEVCRSGCPGIPVTFGDPNYFEETSWTLSYDCVSKTFISWHDWFPSLNIPSKNHFLTTNKLSGKLWRHSGDFQSFANFYDVDYPVEIETYVNTLINETSLQNIEYLLESYQYASNGTDKFLNYDQSFNWLMVYNKEQNSGMQNMFLKQWDNPYDALRYPFFTGTTRNILYQKIENKYRVNDYYDYTKDRGQFTTANNPMFKTDANGYTFSLNPLYFDYGKPQMQLKRFRYTGSRIFLRKTNLGKNSLTIRYLSTKQQNSFR